MINLIVFYLSLVMLIGPLIGLVVVLNRGEKLNGFGIPEGLTDGEWVAVCFLLIFASFGLVGTGMLWPMATSLPTVVI